MTRDVDITIRCRLYIETDADYRFALKHLKQRPFFDGGCYGRDGSFTIRPGDVIRVRRAPVTGVKPKCSRPGAGRGR